jgi:hypothetical protein
VSFDELLSIGLCSLVQGLLVLLPRPQAFRPLFRWRSSWWAVILPGTIIVGTALLAWLPSGAVGLVALATVVTPLLAVVAIVAGIQPRYRWLLIAGLLVLGLVMIVNPQAQQGLVTLITALGCLTLGISVIRLVPLRAALIAIAVMCALDAGFSFAGIGTNTAQQVLLAGSPLHGWSFADARIGFIYVDYPDLWLAGAIGALFAERRRQLSAAVTMVAVTSLYDLLLGITTSIPETLPIALAALATYCWPRRITHLAERTTAELVLERL